MNIKQWCNPGVSRKEMWSWAFYDFANSGYTTVVLTAVFNAYFVNVVVGNESEATLIWTLVIGLSNCISMIIMPMVGALADARANKKKWLLFATLTCIVGTCGLYFTGHGTVFWAGMMVVISNIAYNMGESLSSAFLPELANEESIGKASGWGWGLGYFGGLVALGLALVIVQKLGTDTVPQIMLLTAAIYAIAATPLFLFMKERSKPRVQGGERLSSWKIAKSSLKEVFSTIRNLKAFRDFAQLALTGFWFQCGVSVVITLSAVYASEVMGFTIFDTLVLVFVVNITAAIGAFAFGFVQDRIGHKRALLITLLMWLGMVALASNATHVWMFWIAANLAGLAMGSCQSAGRAMVALLAPPSRLAEFYSFWNMSLWLAAVVGPITYGVITWMTDGNHRLAILSTGTFFLISILCLMGVNMQRGQAIVQAAKDAPQEPEDMDE